jgi:molecular chaperone DnaK
MSKKVIGIDLGSTLSEVAVMEGGKPTIIINSEGERTTPSVVSIKNGERLVGSSAKRQALTNPKTTVNLIKRFMGGTYDEVKENITHVQYDVKNVNGMPRIEIEGKDYTPEEISAMILGKMKKTAEDYLGTEVKDAVITVPAYFSESAREATKNAAIIAGLNPLRLVAEPTAAILASNIDKEKGGKYMVVDYGGSTLDFSIADIENNVIEILASSGDVYTGGSDIDKILASWIVDNIKKESGIDVSGDSLAMTRVNEAAEKVKIELSNTNSTDVNLPYITMNGSTPVHFTKTINRATFESLIDDEINKVIEFGVDALRKANLKASELNGILLVGGSTRIPLVQEKLEKKFGVSLLKSADVDCIVSLGAAVQGGILAGENNDILLLDVTPLNLGIRTLGDVMTTIVEANTTIPVDKEQVFSTAVDNQPSVEIEVLQGNRPMANDNKSLGRFHLDGIAPAPRGVPQIAVKFSISADGLLDVTATDKATGKEQHIRIESKSGLSDSDIERMKAEAKEHEEEDKKRKEEADKYNNADAMLFQIEKAMKEAGDKLTEDEKKPVEDALGKLRNALVDKKIDELDGLMKAVTDAWYPLATKLYQGDSGSAGGFNPGA